MAKRTRWTAGWLAGAALLLAGATGAPAEEWDDPRLDRLERAVRSLQRRAAPSPPGDLIAMRLGDVRLVAGLARVDLLLEVRNEGPQALEWDRTFEMDARAEVIGARLLRPGAAPIEARVLSVEAARRIYGEVRTPRRPTTPRDPLRVERPGAGRLRVTVWPVGPGETVRVHLDFVTPLRGRGGERTYVDVIETDSRPTRPSGREPEGAPGPLAARWMVDPGHLVLAAAPAGMEAVGEAGSYLHFVAASPSPRQTGAPRVSFLDADPAEGALAVRGGGLGASVGVWRFDPAAFLARRGLEGRTDLALRLLRRGGSTSRIAPWRFGATDEPLPVTARLVLGAAAVRYGVEVSDGRGEVLGVFEEVLPVERPRLDADLAGAITGWHRAALVARVLAWAGSDAGRLEQALAFAADAGVLVPETAGLAVPRDEERDLSRASRRQYRRDGAPLGAQRREADLARPPSASVAR